MSNIFKWAVYVNFNVKGVDRRMAETKYEEFKRRMLRSGIKGCKLANFADKHLTFYHVCNKPVEVFEYFYVLNPVAGDDILNNADTSIRRVKVSGSGKTNLRKIFDRSGEGTAKETAAVMKEVN